MAVYTWISNIDKQDHTGRVVLRNGALILLRGEWADFAADELSYMQRRFVMAAGQVGSGPGTVDTVGSGAGSIIFSMPVAQVGDSGSFRLPRDATLARGVLSVDSAPVGSNLVVEIKSGSTVLHTMTIVDGSTADVVQAMTDLLAEGTKISVNATSVGSTPARNVVVQIDMAG